MILTGVAFGSLYLAFRRGSKINYNPEDSPVDLELNPEEDKQVVEAQFEALEVEHEEDKEFDGNVTKLEKEVSAMSNTDIVDYINGFIGVDSSENPLAVTADKSKFDWEVDPSTE